MDELDTFLASSRHYLPVILVWLAGVWLFNLVNWGTGSRLNYLGIWPRHLFGLIGILLAPLLHANFTHLLFNSAPGIVLGLLLLTLHPADFYHINLYLILLSGSAIWLAGRPGIHIGASALIASYFSFLLTESYFYPTSVGWFCALVALYYFGAILFSFIPTQAATSWEGHLCGLLAGVITFIWLY